MAEASAPPLTTREIADRYRRDVNTVAGWINDGVYAPDGKRVYLRASKVGGCWLVEPPDLVAFLRALNPDGAEEEHARRCAGSRAGREAERRFRKEIGVK